MSILPETSALADGLSMQSHSCDVNDWYAAGNVLRVQSAHLTSAYPHGHNAFAEHDGLAVKQSAMVWASTGVCGTNGRRNGLKFKRTMAQTNINRIAAAIQSTDENSHHTADTRRAQFPN